MLLVFASDESDVNVPGTTVLVLVSVRMNEFVLKETGFIGLVNCTTIDEFVATIVAPFAGVTLTTEGSANSAIDPVVNVSLTAVLIEFPAKSATPLTVMVSLVPGVSRSLVLSVSSCPALESVGEVTTAVPPVFRVTWLRLLAATGRSNNTCTTALIGTFIEVVSRLTEGASPVRRIGGGRAHCE